ncbi:MAG: ATP-binding domain-containing protein [Myxococcales bacterium]|nr:ATP-binding domain-containing protein [Myxococcales bacterium]
MRNEVAKNSAGAQIVADEERLSGQVSARVALGEDAGDGPSLVTSDIDRDLVALRDQISEARAEDLAPLVEQMTRLAALRGRLGGGKSLPVDINSPYFAHMRLKTGEGRGGKARDVLVGKRGFIDRASGVQIVDWRNAPISHIYYRYEEGDDYEEEIAGRTTSGMVEVRRNISIHGGKLRRIGAPQGTFIRDARNVWHQAVGSLAPTLHGGVGKAARAKPVAASGEKGKLGVHHGASMRADKALPEIAALIDKEQFDLITQPESGFVVIQGGAGSGKTTVALHRIAFLNFADGRRFRPNAMLFVVPTQSLVRYVAGVLPALGVGGVPVVTYTGWARATRLRLLPETPTKYNEDPPEQVSRVKKHPRVMGMLEQHVADQIAQVGTDIMQTAAGNRDIVEAWNARADIALVPRIMSLLTWVKGANLDSSVRLAMEGMLRRWRRATDVMMDDWAELFTNESLLLRVFAGSDITESDVRRTVRWVKQQTASATQAVDDEGKAIATADGGALEDEDSPAGKLDDEDDPILLRLIQLKRGALITPQGDQVRYNHIAIDEAQDRSSLEVKVLIEAVDAPDDRPNARSITIAGDTAQRLVFDNNFSGWDELLAQTGQAAVVRPLKLSYRSTAEVMLLAREVLGPELAPDDALAARDGEPVELHEFGDVGEAVAFLGDALRNLMAREPSASCAVVSRHPEQADLYYEGLRRTDIPAMRRVRRDEFTFQPGVDVTDVTQVKGLEFDYVVMVDVNAASYPAANWARHLLHIGVTRAAHQLWLVSTGEPSPLIPQALRDGGRMTVG